MKKTITKSQEDTKINLLKLIFLKKNKIFVINLILYFKYIYFPCCSN